MRRPREQVACKCSLVGWPAVCAQASTGSCRPADGSPRSTWQEPPPTPTTDERLAQEAIRDPLPLVALRLTFAIHLLYPPSPTTRSLQLLGLPISLRWVPTFPDCQASLPDKGSDWFPTSQSTVALLVSYPRWSQSAEGRVGARGQSGGNFL